MCITDQGDAATHATECMYITGAATANGSPSSWPPATSRARHGFLRPAPSRRLIDGQRAMPLLPGGLAVLGNNLGGNPSPFRDLDAVLPRPCADGHGVDGAGLAGAAGGTAGTAADLARAILRASVTGAANTSRSDRRGVNGHWKTQLDGLEHVRGRHVSGVFCVIGGDGRLPGVTGSRAVVRAEVSVRQADVAPAGTRDLVTAATVSEPGRPQPGP